MKRRQNNTIIYKRKLIPGRRHQTGATNNFLSDERFNEHYPPSIAALAERHWTPLPVASRAAEFLATSDKVRILDIGSGVGKFCLSAAHFAPQALFFGVEQRKRLIHYADKARESLGLENVSFIHGNFTQLDFKDYDHFYFYNSFYENLDGTDKIDESIEYSGELFNYYNRYLYRQLDARPPGTRLVTYHSLEDEIPPSYHLADCTMNDLLKFWVKA